MFYCLYRVLPYLSRSTVFTQFYRLYPVVLFLPRSAVFTPFYNLYPVLLSLPHSKIFYPVLRSLPHSTFFTPYLPCSIVVSLFYCLYFVHYPYPFLLHLPFSTVLTPFYQLYSVIPPVVNYIGLSPVEFASVTSQLLTLEDTRPLILLISFPPVSI